jgi:hypothetical protein
MKKITTEKLIELKNRFWDKNTHNQKGEIKLPLFFNELHTRKAR